VIVFLLFFIFVMYFLVSESSQLKIKFNICVTVKLCTILVMIDSLCKLGKECLNA